ncbi:MAG: hypothetical protein QJT81_05345 [Candidatus Thiothrix putei]|jgi:Protein of unknown function (DUF2782).|uniref:DUF2782 domain-containing protein n=2 Tax=Thiothrix TaxID=1030 RepID=A0A1H4EMW6_9GAMM|nr:hypothetical protein [Thiothrix caldifontis]WGZ95411.1 MAG: hypothetical protein QJT81_05345 [Candidatus Thiothrix putei]SEA86403.1 hypothetical protein SAMN05660964_02660 [Thiothrix caldifontis]
MTTKYWLTLPLIALLTATAHADEATTDADVANKLKMETIRVTDNFGTIEEERVQAMRTEIRYVPTDGEGGYNLVDSVSSQGKSQNAHQNRDMMIPSWNLFSW